MNSPVSKLRRLEGIGVRVNHGRLEQLKNIGFPLLLPMELLLLETTKIAFPKQSEKSSSGTNYKLAEKGRKRLFEERIEMRMVKSHL